MITIYLLTNLVNGKRYVGQTCKSLDCRWGQHRRTSACELLHRAINKYGADKFEIFSLIEVETKSLANEFEKEYIVRYCTKVPNGYNLTNGGEGTLGRVVSEETRLKVSLKLKGNQHTKGRIQSLSEREKRCGNKYAAGVVWTEERRQQMREIMIGNKRAAKKAINV